LATLSPLLQAGVMGCVARDDTVGNLARAITVVSLPEREAEALRLLATGLTNKDIAQTLILSVRTVAAHLRSIFVKINVRSHTKAVLWAARHAYGPEAIGDSA
jgi:DNA-binding NarL/FixJ family response regulator